MIFWLLDATNRNGEMKLQSCWS